MEITDGDFLVDLNGTTLHTAYSNTTDVVVIVDGGNQQLQGLGLATQTRRAIDDPNHESDAHLHHR